MNTEDMGRENVGIPIPDRTETNRQLFLRQKRTLDLFLKNGAISQAQHDKSLHDLRQKMGIAAVCAETELKLVRPDVRYAEQVMAFKREMLQAGDSFDGCAGLEDVETYTEWADFEQRLQTKYGQGYVPSEVFLAVRRQDDRVVGIIDYRHPLSPFLLRYGGNIGYSVRPGERRKGYAGAMLGLLLPICRQYGETRVLVTCDKTNEASRRTILANGGILENEVADDVGLSECGVIQRYWIAL